MLDLFRVLLNGSQRAKRAEEMEDVLTAFKSVLGLVSLILGCTIEDALRRVLFQGARAYFELLNSGNTPVTAQTTAAMTALIDNASFVPAPDSAEMSTAAFGSLSYDVLGNILSFNSMNDRCRRIELANSTLLFASRITPLFCKSLQIVEKKERRVELTRALMNRRMSCHRLRIATPEDLRLLKFVARGVRELFVAAVVSDRLIGFNFRSLHKVVFEIGAAMREILRFIGSYSVTELTVKRTTEYIVVWELDELAANEDIRSLHLVQVTVDFDSESVPETRKWNTRELICAKMALHNVEHFLHCELRTLRLDSLKVLPNTNRLVRAVLPSLRRLSLKEFVQSQQVFEFFKMPRLKHVRIEDCNQRIKFNLRTCPRQCRVELVTDMNQAMKVQREAHLVPFWKELRQWFATVPLPSIAVIDVSDYCGDNALKVINTILYETEEAFWIRMGWMEAWRLGLLHTAFYDSNGTVLVRGRWVAQWQWHFG